MRLTPNGGRDAIDGLERGPNGAPLLRSRVAYKHWEQVFAQEFAHLQHRVAAGHGGLLSDYGATNPGEFFAVASEVFFEQPQPLADQHPALFAQLRDFYAVNPLSW